LIITANHVITGESATPAQHITVTLPSGAIVVASLVGRDPRTDVAVLQVHSRGLHPALFRTDLAGLDPGDGVVAMGNPGLLARPVTSGYVTAFPRHTVYDGLPEVHQVVESSVPLAPGDSGGPLVDAQARVVGINVAEFVGEKGAVTLPANLVISVVKRLVSGRQLPGERNT